MKSQKIAVWWTDNFFGVKLTSGLMCALRIYVCNRKILKLKYFTNKKFIYQNANVEFNSGVKLLCGMTLIDWQISIYSIFFKKVVQFLVFCLSSLEKYYNNFKTDLEYYEL